MINIKIKRYDCQYDNYPSPNYYIQNFTGISKFDEKMQFVCGNIEFV